MPLKTRGWQQRLLELLKKRGDRAYSKVELLTLVDDAAERIGIPVGTEGSKIIKILTADSNFREIEITSHATAKNGVAYKTIKRFAWGQPSISQIAIALRNGSYLSHATAAGLHELTEPENVGEIYVNKEQADKPGTGGTLTQDGIDRAFKNAPRSSNYVYETRGVKIILLSGKNTGKLGVTDLRQKDGTDLPCTDLERTLIDMTVRPNYAGGVHSVLAAFVAARGRTDLERLAELLRRIAYVYPYQQAVAFYCDRAGYNAQDLQILGKKPPTYDFYLAHKMSKPRYDQRRRIYYPGTLD